MKTKRFISLLLSLILILTALPLVGVASFAETSGDFEYETWDGTAEITYYSGDAQTLYIPSTIDGYPVTCIGWGAFEGCESLTSVTLPDSVTVIEDEAFAYCYNLTNIEMSENITSIGYYAFLDCTNLASITLPESIISIGFDAFDNTEYYNELLNWENGVLYIDNCLIEANNDEIPEDYTINEGTRVIADCAFFECSNLTSITLPNSITTICNRIFENCNNLENVIIPYNVISIGFKAFSGCESLTNITIPESVTSVGSSAFYDTGYSNDTSNWENGALYLDSCLIETNNDEIPEDYTINEGTRVIADYAFVFCDDLMSITIPDSVTTIGERAFWGCGSLINITIPDSVTSIGFWAFLFTGYYKNPSNWENGVLYIDNCLIEANSDEIPEDYAINEGTRVIADWAFPFCESLKSVTIPSSVNKIGAAAFTNCENLLDVYILNRECNIDAIYIKFNEEAKNFSKTFPPDTTIHGYAGSTAESYATEHGNKFVVMEEPKIASGEVSGDGKLSTVDAKWILQNIAKSREFSDEQFKAADLNGDGKLSVVDVKWVLQIVAGMRNAETLELITK